ncbi:MAG: hypothetical protein JWN48_2443 [Myxococcaceae bacterium]|nr:hypothetical protein [Myxococcaceae bacterium]
MGPLLALLIALSLLAFLWSLGRARELCVLSIRRGRLLVMRGVLPRSLYEAVSDVVARKRVRSGTLRVLRDGDRGRLVGRGLDEESMQRLRNVLGTYPMARLLATPPLGPRNLGQRLGVAWLGWWMNGRR